MAFLIAEKLNLCQNFFISLSLGIYALLYTTSMTTYIEVNRRRSYKMAVFHCILLFFSRSRSDERISRESLIRREIVSAFFCAIAVSRVMQQATAVECHSYKNEEFVL